MPARTGGSALAAASGAISAAVARVSVRNRICLNLRKEGIEFAGGQEGSAVFKTRRFPKKTSKHQTCDA